MTKVVILLYLAFSIAANLIIADQGPDATKYVAFLLVGPILTMRDYLHRRWEADGLTLWGRMGLIVIAGSAFSYIASPDAGHVALASFCAFLIAGFLDTVVFQALRGEGLSTRVNASNLVSAGADSVVFFFIAFNPMMWDSTFTQWVAKISGGVVWLLLWHWVRPETSYSQYPRVRRVG
jgi:hypothetical protein